MRPSPNLLQALRRRLVLLHSVLLGPGDIRWLFRLGRTQRNPRIEQPSRLPTAEQLLLWLLAHNEIASRGVVDFGSGVGSRVAINESC